jgi:hypothetical protein
MTVWLRVPYEDKDKAKELGCRWDWDKRKWWKPDTVDVSTLPKSWVAVDKLSARSMYKQSQRRAGKSSATKVLDVQSNIVYPSVKAVCAALNMNYQQYRKELLKEGSPFRQF